MLDHCPVASTTASFEPSMSILRRLLSASTNSTKEPSAATVTEFPVRS